MNLQQQEEFYQMMTRLKANSRAASTKDARVTEMINGMLVSKVASSTSKEPEIIDLQEYAKSRKGVFSNASFPGINKLKAIHDFLRSNGRL